MISELLPVGNELVTRRVQVLVGVVLTRSALRPCYCWWCQRHYTDVVGLRNRSVGAVQRLCPECKVGGAR
jgi:hypothetical protein